MQVAVQECLTAEDVRRNALMVARRRRETRAPVLPPIVPQTTTQLVTITEVVRTLEYLPDIPLHRLIALAYPATYGDRVIRIRDIQIGVCEYYGISLNDMLSAKRTMNLVLPRHIAIALAGRFTRYSLPQIGERFGKRDHTTILHACRKLERVMAAAEARLPANASLTEWVETVAELADTKDLINSDPWRKRVEKPVEKQI